MAKDNNSDPAKQAAEAENAAAPQSAPSPAVDKQEVVEKRVAENAKAAAKNTVKCQAVDAGKALEAVTKAWSREAKKNGDKPPTSLKTKTFAVSVVRNGGAETVVNVSNCFDEADAKCAALQKLDIHPRDCKATVQAV